MKRDFDRLFDAERQVRPAVRRAYKRPRDGHHAIVTADCNVRCRECGAEIEVLHVNDLVVYCGDCCPHCGTHGCPEEA